MAEPTRNILRLAVAVAVALFHSALGVVTIDYVTVGNPGNPQDTTGYGVVGYVYKIGKYEVTISQYAEFLNAKAKSDPYRLWNVMMSDGSIVGIGRSGVSGNYAYSVIGSGNRPISCVSWFDAARFVNWMHNGQGGGATETGAYTLNGAMSGVNFPVQPGAKLWLPTENEWYKAAYYDPSKPGSPYWLYPTQSDNVPSNDLPDAGNNANFYDGTYTLNTANKGTDGGAFGLSGSYYGTFDQGGNVWEWNAAVIGANRGMRGGCFSYDVSTLRSTFRYEFAPTTEGSYIGFRVASASAPRPSATTLAATAITTTGAVLNGSVNGNGTSATVSFQYGPTTSYGNEIAAQPRTVAGTTTTAVNATLSALPPTGLTYHYRVVATGSAGTVTGEDMTFSTTYVVSGPVAVDYVTVGNPGNAADPATGYGAVGNSYRIAKYEISVGQYARFLNAVAKTDPYGLYQTLMGTNPDIAGIARTGASGSYAYSVIGSGYHPVCHLGWFDAARFANWMHNGQGTGSTETGAYTLNGAVTGVFNRNPTARVWIPSENEWYKAAYSKGAAGGYWLYPTQSNTMPGNAIGSGPNLANFRKSLVYSVTQSSVYRSGANYLTDSGVFSGSGSAYGTFDQGGNVEEMTDTVTSGSYIVTRGGAWGAEPISSKDRGSTSTSGEGSSDIGFRVGSIDEATPPIATTLAASGITGTGATLNGSVNANGIGASVSFEYGLTSFYGASVAARPVTVSGSTTTAVSSAIGGLIAGNTYHFRVVVTKPNGTVRGEDMTFTARLPSANALLAALGLNSGILVPEFSKATTGYLATVPFATTSVTVTPTAEHPAATLKVNGVPVASGSASGPITLPVGNTTIGTVVTAEDGVTTKTYMITVTRLPMEFAFNSAADVPVAANGFATGGYPAIIVLNYPPAPGTVLTMVNNTGLGFIKGRFADLAHGQRVRLSYDGNTYDFVASYHGGTGNDLVLQWAEGEVLAWGNNGSGQLGDGTTTRRLLPTPVDAAGALAGRTILGIAGGYLHSVALCSDGTLAAWGYNIQGQLGNGGGEASLVPSMVVHTGVLAGRTVVAVAAGAFHNLALCEDGTVVAWGYNNHGQLGDGTKVNRREPVMVPAVGALAGKQVVAVAAGSYQSFALCDDGTVAAWGYNDEGELGDGGGTGSLVPVAVDTRGALAGRRVASLAAGQYHTLALCTDGTLVAWGYNNHGQVGDNSTAAASSPVAIGTQGALAGRTVVGMDAGGSHSLARCGDGTLAAWGSNSHGQLGAVGISHSAAPLAVALPDLGGGGIAALSAGGSHNLLRLADGPLVAWGDNSNGQLGDGTTLSRATPAAVAGAIPATMIAASGAAAQHHLAVVAKPSMQRVGLLGTAAGVEGIGGDGIAELVRYAFQLDPQRAAADQLPRARLLTGEYVLAFTQPAGIDDIIYGAEWSATMQPGSWQEIPDTGSGSYHRFAIPVAGASRGFIRLKVTRTER